MVPAAHVLHARRVALICQHDSFGFRIRRCRQEHSPCIDRFDYRRSRGRHPDGLAKQRAGKKYLVRSGGRIQKNERIAEAFERILRAETGLQIPFREAEFGRAYEHLYAENCFGDPGFGTHYCVLAYMLRLDHQPNLGMDNQHSKFAWLPPSSPNIHAYSRAYFDLLETRR